MILAILVIVVIIVLLFIGYYLYNEQVTVETHLEQLRKEQAKKKSEYENEVNRHAELLSKLNDPNHNKDGVLCAGNIINTSKVPADICLEQCLDDENCVGTTYKDGECSTRSAIHDCSFNVDGALYVKDPSVFLNEEAKFTDSLSMEAKAEYEKKLADVQAQRDALNTKYNRINTLLSSPNTKQGVKCEGGTSMTKSSIYDCALSCDDDNQCNRFMYDMDTKRCTKNIDNAKCTNDAPNNMVTSFSNMEDWGILTSKLENEMNWREHRLSSNNEFTKYGLNCPNNDIMSLDTTPYDCMKRCDNNKVCKGIVYSGKRCYLKSDISNCGPGVSSVVSVKEPSYLKAELDRLEDILMPEEQEKQMLNATCSTIRIPDGDSSTWPKPILDKYTKCVSAGILKPYSG